MKKFLCVLISVLLITCCFAVNCFAANDGEINGAAVYAAPGSTVELPVKYVNNPGFWIMFLEVNFDPDVFEYVGIENGDYDKAEIHKNHEAATLKMKSCPNPSPPPSTMIRPWI